MAGTDLEQLQQLLARCMDLSKGLTKRDAEWGCELLQQIRIELKCQRREQRKAFEQLIADIRELVENISRRTPPADPAAQRRRPPTVELCFDDEGEPEEHPTAVFVADTSGALRLLVGVPARDAAESRGSFPVTRPLAEPEARLSGKSRSRSRSSRPSQPSPAPAVCVVGKADLFFDVAAVSCSRVRDVKFPSEAAVQSAAVWCVALFEAACQLGAPAREREVAHLEDAPRDR